MSNIYQQIYHKLQRLGVNESLMEQGHAISKSGGFMDLCFNRLYEEEEEGTVISLTHYFEMNGDLVPDPDMEIRINKETKQAEALAFQDQFTYVRVYPEKGKVNLRAKQEQNSFLNGWLQNCIDQGHFLSP